MSDEVDQLLMLLNAHRRTTGIALVQRALAGTAHVAPSVEATISQGRSAIKTVKEALRARGYEVEDVSIIDDANDMHLVSPEEMKSLQDQITTLTNQTHVDNSHKYASNKLSLILLILIVLISGVLVWSVYERIQFLSTATPIESILSSVTADSLKIDGASAYLSIQRQAGLRLGYKIKYTLPDDKNGCSDNNCFARIAIDFDEPQDITAYKYIRISIIFQGTTQICDLYFLDASGQQSGTRIDGSKQDFLISLDSEFKNVNMKTVKSILFNVNGTYSHDENGFTVTGIDFLR